MTRRARKEAPPSDAELTVPGLRVLLSNEEAPIARESRPAAPTASVPEAPPRRRKRRSRFVF